MGTCLYQIPTIAIQTMENCAYFPNKIKLACIGPITAQTLENFGFKTDIIPEEYTIFALAEAINCFAQTR